MITIGVLGPSGTFSEMAAKQFQTDLNVPSSLFFYETIDLVFKHFDHHTYLVLPIENTIDGYVQRTLDLLLKHQGFICKTYDVPISFSYVTHRKNPKTLYAQFKAYNQCLSFLNAITFDHIIKTNNNVESLNLFLDQADSAAIIPTHLVGNHLNVTLNIADQLENETRFIIIKKEKASLTQCIKHAYLVIENDDDKPGILQDILNRFYQASFNLTSIMSRPTKRYIGSYNFFIELVIDNRLDDLNNLLAAINNTYQISLLGLY